MHQLEVVETTRRGDATLLAREAARDGVGLVVVLGGDGTVNEAAGGLTGSQAALAPLPGGSTNVYARTLGYAKGLDHAIDQMTRAVDRGSHRRIGVGSGNGRPFLFHLGAGFDAQVIEQVERHAWLKRGLAHPTFAVTAVTTYFRHIDRTRPPFRVELDGGEAVGDGYYAIVSKTVPYTFFGPRRLNVTRSAGLDTRLALTFFRRLDPGILLSATCSAMGGGRRLERDPDIVQRHSLEQLVIVANRGPFAWHVDGDYLGETERIELRYLPDALTVVTP